MPECWVLQELKNWGSYTYNKNIGVCIVLRHANGAVQGEV